MEVEEKFQGPSPNPPVRLMLALDFRRDYVDVDEVNPQLSPLVSMMGQMSRENMKAIFLSSPTTTSEPFPLALLFRMRPLSQTEKTSPSAKQSSGIVIELCAGAIYLCK